MTFKVLLLLWGLAAVTGNRNNSNNAWKEEREYVYQVKGCTMSGHQDSDQYSGIVIESHLTIVAQSTDMLTAQLSDTQYAEIETEVPDGDCKNIDKGTLKYKPMTMNKDAFKINLKNGILKSIQLSKQVTTWEANIIKGILSQLQLNTQGEDVVSNYKQLPKPNSPSGFYSTMEETVSGKYETIYEISPLPERFVHENPEMVPNPHLKGNGQHIQIIKTKNFDKSQQRVGYHYGLGNSKHYEPFTNQMGQFFTRTSITRAVISGSTNQYTIQSSTTNNKILVSPLLNSKRKIVVVSQNQLILLSNRNTTNNLEVPNNMQPPESLVYRYNKSFDESQPEKNDADSNEKSESSESSESNESGEQQQKPTLQERPYFSLLPLSIGDMGNYIITNEDIKPVKVVCNFCKEIAQDMQNPNSMQKKHTLSKFTMMVSIMRVMSAKELEEVVESLTKERNQEEQQEQQNKTLRHQQSKIAVKIYYDGLAECGTGPVVATIENLIKDNKINYKTVAQLFMQIAQSVRQPTDEYMRHMYRLSTNDKIQSQTHLNTTVTLSYARLVHEVYINKNRSHAQFPSHMFGSFLTSTGKKFVFDEFIPYLTQQLHTAMSNNDHHKAETYISALGLVGHPNILDAFEPYLEGKNSASEFQKTQMVIALNGLRETSPGVLKKVLLKIYQNLGEQQDVRVAAVSQLLKLKLDSAMIQRIAEFTNIDDNEQVNSVVKSAIQSQAQPQASTYYNMQSTAQAAESLLTQENYGIQYSKHCIKTSNVDKLNIGYMQAIETIGSIDSLLPKNIKYYLKSNLGGLDRETMGMRVMLNSVNAFIDSLKDQTQNQAHEQQKHHQAEKSPRNSDYSSENVSKALNMQPGQQEPANGDVHFNLGGVQRHFTFDQNTINQLTDMIQTIEKDLAKGVSLEYNKLLNRHDIAMSIPTATGLPCLYTLDHPVAINLKASAKGNAKPKISSNGTLHRPESINVDAQIDLVVSQKMQGQIGFVTPFEHHHYVAGFDKNVQIQLPLKVEVTVGIKNNVHSTNVSAIHPEQNIQLLNLYSSPYIAKQDILKLKPAISETNVRKIQFSPMITKKQVIGEKNTGIAIRIEYSSEHDHLTFAQIKHEMANQDTLATLMSILEDGTVFTNDLNIEYDAKLSKNNKMHVSFEHKHKYDSSSQNQSQDQLNLENETKQLFALENNGKIKMNEKISAGVKNAEVDFYNVLIKFQGKSNISYGIAATTVRSDVDPVSRIFIHANQNKQNKHNKAVFTGEAVIPNTNGLDPKFTLNMDLKLKFDLCVAYGEHFETAGKITINGLTNRTSERTSDLKNSDTYQACQKEMEMNNCQLLNCANLTAAAGLLDNTDIKIRSENSGEQLINWFHNLLNLMQHKFYHNLQTNYFNRKDNASHSESRINIKFSQNFNRINVSIVTPTVDLKLENAVVDSTVKPLVSIHPVFSAKDRLLSHLLGLNTYKPSCVVDVTHASTIDNKVYPISLGNKWTVMLLHVKEASANEGQQGNKQNPQQPRGNRDNNEQQQQQQNQQQQNQQQQSQKQQQQQQKQQQQHQLSKTQIEKYVVLVRDHENGNGKEVKITLRTPQSQHHNIEINLRPAQQSQSHKEKHNPEVLVNGQKQQISSSESTDLNDGFIKMYALPNHEVKVEVDGAFYVIYDGRRIRLSVTNLEKFRNSIRGLCGTFTGDQTTDFASPQNCIFNNEQQFVKSYQFNQNNSQNAQSQNEDACVQPQVVYANVISDQDVDESCDAAVDDDSTNCTGHKTKYILQNDDIVCFTIRPMPYCKPACKVDKHVSKNIAVHCIKNDEQSAHLIGQIDKGVNPDFSSKKYTKHLYLNVPMNCKR